MSDYRAVFFDVGNTLLYANPSVSEVVREILAENGHVHDLAAIDQLMPLVDAFYEERYQEDDSFWKRDDATSEVWIGMYSLLCRELDCTLDAESIAERVYHEFGKPSRWKAYDDVMPAFERITQAGMRIALISNWDGRLARLVDGLGLSPYVETVLASAEVGLHKPDPAIFRLACTRTGVEPGEAVHVGDHLYADVAGARAVGIQPVLIDRHDGPNAGYEPFIRGLDELGPLIMPGSDSSST